MKRQPGNLQVFRTHKAALGDGHYGLCAAEQVILTNLIFRVMLDGIHDIVFFRQDARRHRNKFHFFSHMSVPP